MTIATRKMTKAEAAALGGHARWGPDHVVGVVKISDLTIDQRRLVLALIDSARATNEKAASGDQTPAAAQTSEGTRDATPTG